MKVQMTFTINLEGEDDAVLHAGNLFCKGGMEALREMILANDKQVAALQVVTGVYSDNGGGNEVFFWKIPNLLSR